MATWLAKRNGAIGGVSAPLLVPLLPPGAALPLVWRALATPSSGSSDERMCARWRRNASSVRCARNDDSAGHVAATFDEQTIYTHKLTEHEEKHASGCPEQEAACVREVLGREVPPMQGHAVVVCRGAAYADAGAGERSDGAGAVAERVDAGADKGGRHDGRRPGGIE